MFTWFVKRSAAYKALEERCAGLEAKNFALCKVNEELNGCRLVEIEKARAGQAELRGDVEELGLALTLRDHEISVLRELVKEQNTALEAALPIVTAYLETEDEEEDDPYGDAIIGLEETLFALENNAPINEKEGNKAQAACERRAAKSVKAAIAALKKGGGRG